MARVATGDRASDQLAVDSLVASRDCSKASWFAGGVARRGTSLCLDAHTISGDAEYGTYVVFQCYGSYVTKLHVHVVWTVE